MSADAAASINDAQSVPQEWSPGDVILDLYEVEKIHREGGMGLVYEVRHRGWGVKLAVKSPRVDIFRDESQIEDFERECETWVNLGLHPNIVSCYYVRRLGGIPRLFLEYAEGGSLSHWIDSARLYEGGRSAALERALDAAIQCAWGLHCAHSQRVTHQDVKPANVMMTRAGAAKITDFGLARALPRAAVDPGMGQSAQVTANGLTPAYCSPEQFYGLRLDQSTDVWSWGLLVLEMFAGRLAWHSGILAPAVLEDFLQAEPVGTMLPPMPKRLCGLLRRCFDRDPDARPSMLEAAQEVQGVHEAIAARPYAREMRKLVELRGGSLNNRALSLLDLEQPEAALSVLDEAAQGHPRDPLLAYNRGLLRWRAALVSDLELLASVRSADYERSERWLSDYCQALIHFERGDVAATICSGGRVAELGGDSEARSLLRHARDLGESNPRCLGAIELEGTEVEGDIDCLCGSGQRLMWVPYKGNCAEIYETASGKRFRVLQGHGARIESSWLSADGRLAVTGSADRRIRVWDVDSGRCIQVLRGHTGQVGCVAVSSDQRLLLSGSDDRDVRLWDLHAGRCLMLLSGHRYLVQAVAFSPDGRFALSGEHDGELRLWRLQDGRCLRAFKGPTQTVRSHGTDEDGNHLIVEGLSGSPRVLSFQADGRTAVSWHEGVDLGDPSLRVWSLESGELLREVRLPHVHLGSAFACTVHGAMAAPDDGSVWLYEVPSGRRIRTISLSPEETQGMCISEDGSCAAFLTGRTVQVWSLGLMRGLASSRRAPGLLSKAVTSGDAASMEARFEALLRDAEDARRAGRYAQALERVAQARTLPGQNLRPRALDIWNAIGLHCARTRVRAAWVVRELELPGKAKAIALCRTRPYVLAASYEGSLCLWDIATGERVQKIDVLSGKTTTACATSDFRWAVSGAFGSQLQVWDLVSGSCVGVLQGHRGYITKVAISPDDRWLLSVGKDLTLGLWELATGRFLRELWGHSDLVRAIAFSNDGCWVVSGDEQGTLCFWRLTDGKPSPIYKAHSAGVNALAFFPGGRYVASAGDDHTIKVWDRALRACKLVLENHNGVFAAWTPDCRWAVSPGEAGLEVYDLSAANRAQRFAGPASGPVGVAANGRWVVSAGRPNRLQVWELEWELQPVQAPFRKQAVLPYLRDFVSLHMPYRGRIPRYEKPTEAQIIEGLSRGGRPRWSEEDFTALLGDLAQVGLGWCAPADVRNELDRVAGNLR